jgi:urea transport system ATP-binding protein
MERVLQTKNLTKAFGGLVAVDHVNFSMSNGELRSVIGPNGCGKTTFFNLVTGRFKPTEGQVLYKGEDIANLSIHEIARKGVGRKFQVPSIFDSLSVYENIRVPLFSDQKRQSMFVNRSIQKEYHDRILGILDDVRLTGKGNEFAKNLSHGEKQWLEIGMALAAKPSLLLLDEPTAGMTIGETRATVGLIKKISIDLDISIIVIEHDISFVREIESRVTVLYKGQIINEGTFEEIHRDKTVREIYLGRGD